MARLTLALDDVRSLPSSLRLLAYKMGALPMEMPWAQTVMSLG